MSSLRPFRFGVVSEGKQGGASLINTARRAETLGYHIFLMPDHIGIELAQIAPVPALAAIAAATTTIHIGTIVFDNDFRHPVLLAKEIATLDLLSNGRFEWGLGAGWHQAEYEQSGIPFDPAGQRVSRMEEALTLIKALLSTSGPVNFSGQYYTVKDFISFPQPSQRPFPPLIIGGGGTRLLKIAARHADSIGVMPKAMERSFEDAREKVNYIRQMAGDRWPQIELNILASQAIITNDRRAVAEQLTEVDGWRGWRGVPIEQILTTPHVLLGTVEEICAQLLSNREQLGISYIAIYEESMEDFAPVVAQLMGK
jgi:probable F420-dependent oxidoreductase